MLFILAGSYPQAEQWAREHGVPRGSWNVPRSARSVRGWDNAEYVILSGYHDNSWVTDHDAPHLLETLIQLERQGRVSYYDDGTRRE